MITRYEAQAGESIATAAENVVKQVEQEGWPQLLVFNSINFWVYPNNKADEVVSRYNHLDFERGELMKMSTEDRLLRCVRLLGYYCFDRAGHLPGEGLPEALKEGDAGAIEQALGEGTIEAAERMIKEHGLELGKI